MNKLVYWEIPTTDLEKTTAFFSSLFGWKMEPSGESYVMFHVEDGMGGGLQQVAESPTQGIRVYIGVEDIPATLAKAEGLGGKTVQPKTDIGNDWGYWASFEAPGGSTIGLWSKQ